MSDEKHPEKDCCKSGNTCTTKVTLNDDCCNIDKIREQIKLVISAFTQTLKTETDLFDLTIIDLLDKLKCPDEIEVDVCITAKCKSDDCDDDDDDDHGHGHDDDDHGHGHGHGHDDDHGKEDKIKKEMKDAFDAQVKNYGKNK